MLKHTRQGTHFYAIGGNAQAARVSGINVERDLMMVYTYAGILYGIAGTLLASRLGLANSLTANGMELDAIAAVTGELGLAMAFSARQLTARFFIGGFADQAQREQWLPRIAAGQQWAAIAISEPGAGAHPKHLQTSAEITADGVRLRGRKAFITNAPVADLFLVLAIVAVHDGRKRYGLFAVPHGTPGLTVTPMRSLDVLAPASHGELNFDDCLLPADARIGTMADAYPAMALPFRDLEDTIEAAHRVRSNPERSRAAWSSGERATVTLPGPSSRIAP